MKKIAIIILSFLFAAGAVSAQKVVVKPRPVQVAPHPRIVYYPRTYYNPYWNPYFYGGLGFNWYNRPVYNNHLTKMERQIQDIENDYKDRIESVRSDNDLSGKERRQKVRELKHERDQEIANFKSNYYKQFENK